MYEDKVAYEDRAAISYKTEYPHPINYIVVDTRNIALTNFLSVHEHIFNDAHMMRTIRVYVKLTLVRRFASSESLHRLNELPFYQQTALIQQIEHILGCALETIPPFQLHSFFAFVFGWVSFREMAWNYADDGYFEQTIEWPSGRVTKEYFPKWLVPSSPIKYIAGRLGLANNKSIQRLDFDGFQSAAQIGAAMNGYLRYYTSPR